MLQQTFFSLMSVHTINHENKVEAYLKALTEAMGVEWKER